VYGRVFDLGIAYHCEFSCSFKTVYGGRLTNTVVAGCNWGMAHSVGCGLHDRGQQVVVLLAGLFDCLGHVSTSV
jgi:hypothetical protein